MRRTDQQNKALHKYFRMLAEALAEQHYDFRDLKIELKPTEYLVKEFMWRPIQEALYGSKSTTELEKMEIADIYDHLNRALSDRLGVHVPFPSEETKDDEKA